MNASLEDRRVLVTGATGFIGQHLTKRLTELNSHVWAGVMPGEAPERVEALPSTAHQLLLDIENTDSVQSAVDRCDPEFVFHLAAVGVSDSHTDSLTSLQVNTGGAIRLMEALGERALQRLVLAGTCHEYGARAGTDGLDPSTFYAASKVAAWAFARAYWSKQNLPVVTTRLFQVYGPGQPVHTLIPAAVLAALRGLDFEMTPGEQRRDFVYVEDVIDGLIAAAAAPSIEGQSLDLGTGQTYEVRRVVELIWTLTESSGLVLPGALEYRPGVVMHLAADASRTSEMIGWQADIDLESGLKLTIDHLSKTNYENVVTIGEGHSA
jgi:nucleoside-diphosphate-sugar epimerase